MYCPPGGGHPAGGGLADQRCPEQGVPTQLRVQERWSRCSDTALRRHEGRHCSEHDH